jgi:alpha-mannosidase
MPTLHLVSHTHWDREWYQTFQQFRFKLVNLVDELLRLLEADPDYKHFLLDGQTIILEDYLQIRPGREAELRSFVQNSRLLIGPWYVLPDEFLVSSEAIIRNLLEGRRISQHFGPRMKVGYIPDPFGHIGQMPQIFWGFGIQSASFRRGLDDQSCEIWWRSPDGTSVLLAYLRDGYDNAAALPVSNPEAFTVEVQKLRDSLLPYCATSHILLMQGTDHMFPQAETSTAVAYANRNLESDTLIHSTLPAYLAAIQAEIDSAENSSNKKALEIPTITGELRSGKRHHLLPGVLSTRVWIKQRNHNCQIQLEKWAEPFTVFAEQMDTHLAENLGLRDFIHYAWRLLMENHPHDSICGCSIDQVHIEMRTRFDQVDQVSADIINQCLQAIADQSDTWPGFPSTNPSMAVTVFNPSPISRSEYVFATLPATERSDQFQIADESGSAIPFQIEETNRNSLAHLILDRQGLFSLLGGVSEGVITGLPISGMTLQHVQTERSDDEMKIYAALSDSAPPNPNLLMQLAPEMTAVLADESIQRFVVQADSVSSQVGFLASDVPSFGYKTYWFCPANEENLTNETFPSVETLPDTSLISNEFFALEFSPIDGSFSLTDLRNGLVYPRLNFFLDCGDRGDEYNFCPLEEDIPVAPRADSFRTFSSSIKQSIQVEYTLTIPLELTPGRNTRSPETIPIRITSNACLFPGIPRLEFHTEIENQARDHRLRVHFATPFTSTVASYDEHFDILDRSIAKPEKNETWVEKPRPEAPQCQFTAVSGEKAGLVLANRGLPEIEVFHNTDGKVEFGLTLMRCVGWLSRDDLPNRQGHAGPGLPTPGAQLPGRWAFDYALIPYTDGNFHSAIHQAYAFNTPLKTISTSLHKSDHPSRYSFVHIEPLSFITSAIKPANEEPGWVIRGYNPFDEPIRVKIQIYKKIQSAFKTNLAEQIIEEIGINPDGSLTLIVEGKKIISLLLR